MGKNTMQKISLSGKKWVIKHKIEKQEELFDSLLKRNNLKNPQEIRCFFEPSITDCHSPYKMKGMRKAVNRILLAIEKKEHIMVFGDFDADGITASVILIDGLIKLGAKISYKIPNRNIDSHGLKKDHVKEMMSKNIGLIITCDCGINDQEAIKYAHESGIDVLVTDHHEPDLSIKNRSALAIVNPIFDGCTYPEKNLAGAGIALKLMQALDEEKKNKLDIKKYFELATIGTIADCVSLTGENRIITRIGLKLLQDTSWAGLRKMLERARTDLKILDEQTIGFVIAPRLNASSRVGNVETAIDLFLGDANKQLSAIEKLEIWNEKRKSMTQEAMMQSFSQIKNNASCQVLYDREWEPGILGLVAGRHSENLQVPVVATTIRDDGLLAASCRAPKGFSMIEALCAYPVIFERFGGHDGAAGFVTDSEKLDQIKESLNTFFDQEKKEYLELPVEAFLSSELLDFEIIDFLKSLSPFGAGNSEPIFGLENCEVIDYSLVGKLKNHIRLVVKKDERIFPMIAFFAENFIDKIQTGQYLDVLFTLSDQFWNGKRRLEASPSRPG